MAKHKWYVVWKGRATGIFSSWAECSKQVTGFNGAEYKAFENRAVAEEAFRSAYSEYKGKHAPSLNPGVLKMISKPLAESYCVDASCIRNPGPMEYRCLHTTTRQQIFRQGPFENGSNNVGEFLAIVHALALFQKRGVQDPIYTDSEIALKWVKGRKCKTKLLKDEKNRPIFELIERAEDWLMNNDYANALLKWDTRAWGEIPADYGRK